MAATKTATKPKTEQAEPGTAVATKSTHPLVVLKEQLDGRSDQFRAALPAHIPVERFQRIVLTAVQNNPRLLACDRPSFWNACMRAAQDGLLPDGRDGAIVEYKTDGKVIAQWLVMIGGLRKKVRNSGDISTWEAHVVHEHDEFAYELGDEPFIRHKPAMGERGNVVAAYSIAKLKDGSLSREVMTVREIERIRAKSRAKHGPWSDATFYPEMCRKTVARRHSKVLPMSSDLDDLIRRDDDLYDFDDRAAPAVEEQRTRRLTSVGAAFDHFAAADAPAIQRADEPDAAQEDKPASEPGEKIDMAQEGAAAAAGESDEAGAADGGEAEERTSESETANAGTATTNASVAKPTNAEEYSGYAKAKIAAVDQAAALRDWWNSQDERKLRNACGVTREWWEPLNDAVKARVADLEKPAEA